MQYSGRSDPADLPDETELWRRVPIRPGWVIYDANEGRVRPSSGAFKDNQRGSVSAFIAAECGGADVVLAGHGNFAIVSLSLGLVRACGLEVVRDESEGQGLGHVLLVGNKDRRVESDPQRPRVCEALAQKCTWLGEPPSLPDS